VIYYQLPEMKDSEQITMEIKDDGGNVVRSFSSKADSTYKKYDGGPPAEPVLSKNKGLNRFVWNMRYATMPGVPGIYIESSYNGHKAVPGKYSVIMTVGEQKLSTDAEILSNLLYPTDANTYREYHLLMSQMENEVKKMHLVINSMNAKREQLDALLKTLPDDKKYDALRKEGADLSVKMKSWDDDMVQRKAKAYDDVDNFENKFTANYMFLINQTESEIPRVNQPSLDRKKELDGEWTKLQARANEILEKELPSLNKKLWEAGVGAVWK
jgi:hypothetical protein